MTTRPRTKSAAPWPMLSACAAMNWLPFFSASESLSCTAPRFVSPERSRRLVTHVGNASRSC